MWHSHGAYAHTHPWGEVEHYHSTGPESAAINGQDPTGATIWSMPPATPAPALAPAPTPTPAPVPPTPPVETEYDRRTRLGQENRNHDIRHYAWSALVIVVALALIGGIALGVVYLWPNSQEVASTTVTTAAPAQAAAPNGITVEQMVEAMKQAGYTPASSPAQGQPAQADQGQPAQDQSVQGSSQIGSVNDAPAYGNDPETYVPHPLSYQETGIKGAVSWTLELLPNTTLIVGGFTVDGTSGGVYKAIKGGQTVKVTVTDGFYSIVPSEWGQNEYNFRVGEAEKYGWAMAHLSPLSEWNQ